MVDVIQWTRSFCTGHAASASVLNDAGSEMVAAASGGTGVTGTGTVTGSCSLLITRTLDNTWLPLLFMLSACWLESKMASCKRVSLWSKASNVLLQPCRSRSGREPFPRPPSGAGLRSPLGPPGRSAPAQELRSGESALHCAPYTANCMARARYVYTSSSAAPVSENIAEDEP